MEKHGVVAGEAKPSKETREKIASEESPMDRMPKRRAKNAKKEPENA